MHYLRIYADAAGETHFEDVEVAMSPIHSAAGIPLPGTVSESIAAARLAFRHVPADTYIDWHPAPQRQFVVTLAGSVEFTTSDGDTRQLGPGGIMLADDPVGKGHTSRVLPGADWHNVWVPVAG